MKKASMKIAAGCTILLITTNTYSFMIPDGEKCGPEVCAIARHDKNRAAIALSKTTDNEKALALKLENTRFSAEMVDLYHAAK